VAGNYSESAVGRPVKVTKPKISRKKKDPEGGTAKPKFSGSKGSKTMRPDKGAGLPKAQSVHMHSKRAVKKTKRAK
jgi:hypothetical protein